MGHFSREDRMAISGSVYVFHFVDQETTSQSAIYIYFSK